MTAPRKPFYPPNKSIRAQESAAETHFMGVVDYKEAWDTQARLAASRYAGETGDHILVLEHPDIYTAGKRTQPEDRPTNGLPVIDVDRGGRITWHGRGQLVVYPIIQLAEPIDVVDYVRRLEEAAIEALRRIGLTECGRIEGRSGVWLPETATQPARKVAALGIRVTHGVTMHGMSVNCNNTLDFYEHIVPCGIADAGVTTISNELNRTITPDDLAPVLLEALNQALDGTLQVQNHTIGTAPDPTKNLPARSATKKG